MKNKETSGKNIEHNKPKAWKKHGKTLKIMKTWKKTTTSNEKPWEKQWKTMKNIEKSMRNYEKRNEHIEKLNDKKCKWNKQARGLQPIHPGTTTGHYNGETGSRTSTHPPGVIQRGSTTGNTTGNKVEKQKMKKIEKSYL